MRTRWTAPELVDHRLVVLVDLVYAGVAVRVATEPLELESDAGARCYDGTLEALTWSRSIDLFSLSAEGETVTVSACIPLDVPTLRARGHVLEGCSVQISQVRIDRDGVPADTWEERRVCLTGRVRDAEYGAYEHDDGRGSGFSAVHFGAERGVYKSADTVPRATERVDRSTFRIQGHVGGMDVDLAYPLPIGYPGRDTLDWNGCIPAYRAVWLSKQTENHCFAVAVGKIDATEVRINHEDDAPGIVVTVGNTMNLRGSAFADEEARDARGQLLTVVDYSVQGYESGDPDAVAAVYRPGVDEQCDVWVGFPSGGGGGILYNGKLLREAGDVVEWMLLRSGLAVDFGSIAAAKPLLSWCLIDAVIDEACDPLDWLIQHLFPLVPVSLYGTESGITLWAWNPDATRADAVCHIDADTDTEIDVAEMVKEDASNVVNRFKLSYALNRKTGKYEYAVRLGPDSIAPTVSAEGVIWQYTGSPTRETDRIYLYARETGEPTVPITVTLEIDAAYGVPTVTTDDATTGTVVIQADENFYDTSDIVTAINTGSTLVEAQGSADNNTWRASQLQNGGTVTLRIHDWGTASSSLCAQSRDIFAAGDVVSGEPGIREEAISTILLYDHGVPPRVLDWKAAAYALPQRRVEFVGPESRYGWLEPGTYVTFTKSSLGFARELAVVEAADDYTNGTVGRRLVFIDSGARLASEV